MFLVTGGFDDFRSLDVTETLDLMMGSWAMSGASLPRPMTNLCAANINDRVLIFGEFPVLIRSSMPSVPLMS